MCKNDFVAARGYGAFCFLKAGTYAAFKLEGVVSTSITSS
jgi:hypothetical protein